ncbi:MAG: TonB-dependent receptor plug domain-containing protein [Proteobacteria bacterium]|nr:TonB-dependent receptor plug domain-containing protein [Pseudomonadota bacterium]
MASTLLAGVAAAALAGQAEAATQPDSKAPDDDANAPPKVEEVVITARRVAENIQKVPVAATALNPTALREKAITTPTELMFHAPSVQMSTLFGKLSGGFSVRGLSGGTTTYYAEVAGGPTEAGAPLFDIGSVQVLNGPQGTLFGRANTAGAVLIEPQHPALDRVEGSLDVTQGGLGMNRVTGVLNLPLVRDHLALRVAVNRNHLDGDTQVTGSAQRLNEENSQSLRVGLDWRPGGGAIRNYAVFDYFHVDQSPGALVLAAVNPNLAIFNLPSSISAANGLAVGTATFGTACNAAVAAGLSADLNSCIDQRLQIAATFKPALLAEYQRVSQGGGAVRLTPGSADLLEKETLHRYNFVDKTDVDLGHFGDTSVSFRNIFGFQAVTGATGWTVDGLGGLLQESVSVSGSSAYGTTPSGQQVGSRAVYKAGPYQYTYSDEAQLHGVLGRDLLRWTVGGYYQNTPSIVNTAGIRNLSRVFSGITLATLGYNPSFPFADGGFSRQTAVFGQGTLDLGRLTPFIGGLHLTGGLRKTWDKQVLTTLAAVTQLPSGAYVPGAASTTATASSGYNSTVSLDAQISDRLLVYGATRSGYRPGGINQVLNASAFPNFTQTYAPETVRDYELGAKWDFALGDARGRLNGALYRTDYSNIQRTFSGSANGVTATYVVNASAAVIQGVELQGQLLFGRWDASATYSYGDAKFTNWIGSDPLGLIKPGNARCLPQSTTAICLIDLASSPFPNIPKHQGSVTIKYYLPLDASKGRASLAATGYFQSRKYFTDAAARNIEQYGEAVRDAVSQPAYSRFNLRADWDHVFGSDFSVAAFVNNLTNVNYALTAVTQLHSLGNATKLYGEPRTYGVQLRYEFGR